MIDEGSVGTTHANFCRIRIKERGKKRRIVIIVTISSSILIKYTRRICDEKFFKIRVSDIKIIIYDMSLFLYMVEVRGSNPLSPTLLKACKSMIYRLFSCLLTPSDYT